MPFVTLGLPNHDTIPGVSASDHHTATVAGDLNLADLAARAHADLSDAPADAHHAKYLDSEAEAAIEAKASLNIQGQINFPDAQSASADANTLDDYEEGAWTPTIQDASGSNGESQTYATQIGLYVKKGREVFITCELTLTSLGTLTAGDDARLAGLPFANNATNQSGAGFHVGVNLAITAGVSVAGNIIAGATHFVLSVWEATTGTNTMLISEVSADGRLRVACSYLV